jgi:hypothetical protein
MLLASDTSEDPETVSPLMSLSYITGYNRQKEAPAEGKLSPLLVP